MADHLSPGSLDWSRTHIEKFGDTDLFPFPFEYEAIRNFWLVLRDEVVRIDLCNYEGRAFRRFLVPKPTGGFRVALQLDPLDTLIFTSMVYEAAEQLEAQRAPKERKIACSYRLAIDPEGRLYSSQDGWSDFSERSSELAHSGVYSYVVLTDISDFYNQISHHRIRNILETAGVSSLRSMNIERFLMNLTRGHSRGIPVGPSASILLAEACLADVDTFLIREGYVHTRYVDDFRIFCENKSKAFQALHDLSEYLYTAHRLALHSDKTEPLDINEFISKYHLDPEKMEHETREDKLQALVEMFRDLTGYNIGVSEISAEEKREAIIESLSELFEACLSQKPLHLGWARYLLRRATSLKTNVILNKTVENLETLAPVMRDVGRYLQACVSVKTEGQIGQALVRFISDSDVGFLPFIRLWVLEVLIRKLGLAFEEDIMRIARESARVGLELRSLALLARERGHIDWVRRQKEIWQNCAPWDRRAVIWASSALPTDERRYWIKRVENAGDLLDRIVAKAVNA